MSDMILHTGMARSWCDSWAQLCTTRYWYSIHICLSVYPSVRFSRADVALKYWTDHHATNAVSMGTIFLQWC